MPHTPFPSPTECRPCTEEELLHLYCSGDFVARGSILAVTDKPRLDLTSLTIRASKIFQQTYPVFGHGHAHPHRTSAERGTQRDAEDEEENDISFSSLVEEGSYIGKVVMPMQCGARWGDGEFLVMGVMRLGQPLMRCAPRYEEWLALTRRAQSQAQCILES
ncbi:Meteorin-like protein [Portunus trituberculatus]|uniref:Meteorin-like protein n=1 Tax=Portunus trituberculatus TaxID=210409 RepID=A0A5B7HZY0_PORTR|nr:Meteorin-like protein [Portunus trituberculatus]